MTPVLSLPAVLPGLPVNLDLKHLFYLTWWHHECRCISAIRWLEADSDVRPAPSNLDAVRLIIPNSRTRLLMRIGVSEMPVQTWRSRAYVTFKQYRDCSVESRIWIGLLRTEGATLHRVVSWWKTRQFD